MRGKCVDWLWTSRLCFPLSVYELQIINELKCETLIIVLKIIDHKPCLSLFDHALLCFMLLISVCGRSLAAHYPKERRRVHCILAIIFFLSSSLLVETHAFKCGEIESLVRTPAPTQYCSCSYQLNCVIILIYMILKWHEIGLTTWIIYIFSKKKHEKYNMS